MRKSANNESGEEGHPRVKPPRIKPVVNPGATGSGSVQLALVFSAMALLLGTSSAIADVDPAVAKAESERIAVVEREPQVLTSPPRFSKRPAGDLELEVCWAR